MAGEDPYAAIITNPWTVGKTADGEPLLVARAGESVGRVPLDGLGPETAIQVAEHVAELHAANLAGRGISGAYAPASWYADAAGLREQALRRPWEAEGGMFRSGPVAAVAVDGQFGDRVLVIEGGPPSDLPWAGAIAEYVVSLHNESLLPIR